jgi:MFS family permease
MNNIPYPKTYSWLIFLISASFLFYKYILQISPSVMTNELMNAYSLTGTSLGFLVGFYYYTYLIMQIPSGILLDKYGTRLVTSIAIFLCALGGLLFAMTQSFVIACYARLLIGLGASFATTSYMKLCSIWFPARYFPLLSGLFGTACMLGACTAEAPLAYFVHGFGWRNTLLFCGLSGVLLSLLFSFFVTNQYKTVGNYAVDKVEFRIRQLGVLFRSRHNLALILYGGLAFTPVAVFGGLWGTPFLTVAYMLSKSAAATAVSLVFLGFAVGGVVIGWLGNHYIKKLPIVIGGTASAILCLIAILYVPHMPLWLLYTAIFLFGFGSSSFLLSYAIARSTNSVALVGTVIGIINMGDPICGAFAEPLIGKILDLHWGGLYVNGARAFSIHAYHLGLSVLIGYLILALLCCYFIKED